MKEKVFIFVDEINYAGSNGAKALVIFKERSPKFQDFRKSLQEIG